MVSLDYINCLLFSVRLLLACSRTGILLRGHFLWAQSHVFHVSDPFCISGETVMSGPEFEPLVWGSNDSMDGLTRAGESQHELLRSYNGLDSNLHFKVFCFAFFRYPNFCLLSKSVEPTKPNDAEWAQCIKAFITDLYAKVPVLCDVPLKLIHQPQSVANALQSASKLPK